MATLKIDHIHSNLKNQQQFCASKKPLEKSQFTRQINSDFFIAKKTAKILVRFFKNPFHKIFEQWNISLGLDDEEQLDEIIRDSGQFLVQCPSLGTLDGQISILRDFEEDVYILLGATKDFDHFHIQRMDGDNLKLPKG